MSSDTFKIKDLVKIKKLNKCKGESELFFAKLNKKTENKIGVIVNIEKGFKQLYRVRVLFDNDEYSDNSYMINFSEEELCKTTEKETEHIIQKRVEKAI